MNVAKSSSDPDAVNGLPKVAAKTAREILARYEPGAAAVALAEEDTSPPRFMELLFARELYEDALSFLAYGLPRREALWWGLGCVSEITPEESPPAILRALAVVEEWVGGPNDERRREAMVAAEEATYGTPAGCLALAVFFSEGSMAPPDCPAVPVGEWFCARTTAAALLLASLQEGQEKAPATAKAFLERGIDVARNAAPWDDAPPEA